MNSVQSDPNRPEREAVRRRRELLETADFKAVTAAPAGRRFIRRVLAECGVHQVSFAGEESHRTAFREGRRSVGLWLQSLFEEQPERYLELLKEGRYDNGDSGNK